MTLPTIETPRLVLRPFVDADAADVERLAGDIRIASTTVHIPHPYPVGGASPWIASLATAFARRERVVLAVTKDGAVAGAVGLSGLARADHDAELSYWIGVPFQGAGLATEASRALVAHAREHLGVERVHASCFHGNAASARVLVKLGMHHVSTTKDAIEKLGRRHDMDHYSF